MSQNIQHMELGNLLFGNSRGEFPIDRQAYQDIFNLWLHDHGFDGYGYPETDIRAAKCKKDGDSSYFENDMFIIRPYYWGEDETIAEKPNFVYKPKNIEISWYKYPFRDSYSNVELTEGLLQEILDECAKSLAA